MTKIKEIVLPLVEMAVRERKISCVDSVGVKTFTKESYRFNVDTIRPLRACDATKSGKLEAVAVYYKYECNAFTKYVTTNDLLDICKRVDTKDKKAVLDEIEEMIRI